MYFNVFKRFYGVLCQKEMLILIAGPYRGGTNDDPVLIRKNLERLEDAAYEVYLKGHTPLIGEWVALPLMKRAGSTRIGDEVYTKMSYPIAHSLLAKCDAVFRISGESKGADQDVVRAKELGLSVFYDLNDIPNGQ